MGDQQPAWVQEYDPDPIVDVLNILSALGNLSSIGSFVQGLLQPDRKIKKATILKLSEKNAAVRVQLQSVAEIYSRILEIRRSSKQPPGFAPSMGVRVGAQMWLTPDRVKKLLRLRRRLIRRTSSLQTIVVSVMQELERMGLPGETPYVLYSSLRDSINELLQDAKRPLSKIDEDTANLISEADRISKHVGDWLSNHPQSQ